MTSIAFLGKRLVSNKNIYRAKKCVKNVEKANSQEKIYELTLKGENEIRKMADL